MQKILYIKSFLSFLQKHYFISILLLLLCYSLLEVYRSSFVIEGTRYFSLFDDEMISMRYANNFAQGSGLVWNPLGERVEGFTNPLWVGIMALFHFIPIPLSKISLVIQLINVGLLIITLILVRNIANKISGNILVTIGSVLLTAFYYPLILWAILGTEVTLIIVFILLSVSLLFTPSNRKRNIIISFVLLSLSTMVRLDSVVPAAVVSIYIVVFYRKSYVSAIKLGLGILIISLISQVGLRYLYYHEIFPNTYFLKMTGYPWYYRVSRGLFSAVQFIVSVNWIIGLLAIAGAFFKRKKEMILLSFLILFVVFYSMYVGGDAWEYFGGSNRFISTVMPLFFILVSIGFASIISYSKKIQGFKSLYHNRIFFLFIFLYLAFINFANPDMFLESILIKQPQFIPANKVNIERALLINSITDNKATIAIQWAGTTPYFSQRTYIDMFGKNDKKIAREKAHQDSQMPFWMRLNYFYPGHMKWNYAYSIGNLKPDIIAEGDLPDEADPYLIDYDHLLVGNFVLYIKKNSPHVDLSNAKVSRKIPSWSPPYVLK